MRASSVADSSTAARTGRESRRAAARVWLPSPFAAVAADSIASRGVTLGGGRELAERTSCGLAGLRIE